MKRGSPSSTSSSAARNGATAGAIDGEWKAPATGSRIARLPSSPATSSARSKFSRSPASTICPGALSLATIRLAALRDLRGLVLVGPDQRDHRATVVGLGHQPAAQHDELERVLDREHARGGKRGELAERVAGGGAGLDVVLEPAPAGDRCAEDRGLLKAGALVDAREGILAYELEAALEQLGAALGDEVAHIGGLAPLAGEQDRGIGGQSHSPTPSRACAGKPGRTGDLPPSRGGGERAVGGAREQLRDTDGHLATSRASPGAT